MTQVQISDLRKRATAEHHAAHLVVACITGGKARAWLWQGDTAAAEPATWHGQTAVIKYGHVGATQVAGMVADAMAYVPGRPQVEYFDDFFLSEFACPEDGEELSFSELFDLVTNVQVAVNHLVQHREFYDWAVDRLMTTGLITEGDAEEFIKTSHKDVGAPTSVVQLRVTEACRPEFAAGQTIATTGS